ncbi:MAG: site-2 protease family protein, partial [Armatimonadota bacterium]
MQEVERIIPQLIIIFLSIALHEFGHAKSADAAGDPTPRMMGRVTLNPFAHLDPLGSVMVLITVFSGFGIGWGKPVLVDPRRMQNPRWDHFMSVLWGPLTNIILAVACAVAFRFAIVNGISPLDEWMFFAVVINLALAFFNLLPLGPLDGHWLVGAML